MLKVGLVGWGAATGNGGMNADIARLSPWISSWLCPKHPELGWHEPYIKPVVDKVVRCKHEGDVAIYNQFLEGLDVVLFIEQTYLVNYDLVDQCKQRDIFTVCIPMWEWWPERKPWSQGTDMVWCVTNYTRSYLQSLAEYLMYRGDYCNWRHRIYGDRWGIELEEFNFMPREKAQRFLFVNGNGGGKGRRKGSDVLAVAASYIPDIEIIMLTQNDNYPTPMPENVIVDCNNYPTKREVFQQGDVFIAPSHWEGLGHQLYEAQASGLPVITIDAPPMNECGADWLIPVSQREPYMLSGKQIPKVTADAKQLAEVLRSIQDCNISQKSKAARARVEERNSLRDVLEDLRKAIEDGMRVDINQEYLNLTGSQSYSHEKIERLGYEQKVSQIYGEAQIEYRMLVWDAWYAYQQGNLDKMFQCLKKSVQFTPFLKIETVTDWLDSFSKLSLERGKQLDTYSLTSLSEWRQLIQNIQSGISLLK